MIGHITPLVNTMGMGLPLSEMGGLARLNNTRQVVDSFQRVTAPQNSDDGKGGKASKRPTTDDKATMVDKLRAGETVHTRRRPVFGQSDAKMIFGDGDKIVFGNQGNSQKPDEKKGVLAIVRQRMFEGCSASEILEILAYALMCPADQVVNQVNASRKCFYDIELSGQQLRELYDLGVRRFEGVNLEGETLTGDLSGADFRDARFYGVTVDHVDFSDAKFKGCKDDDAFIYFKGGNHDALKELVRKGVFRGVIDVREG
jgi:hypothetical protein